MTGVDDAFMLRRLPDLRAVLTRSLIVLTSVRERGGRQKKDVDSRGIEPLTSRMQSERYYH